MKRIGFLLVVFSFIVLSGCWPTTQKSQATDARLQALETHVNDMDNTLKATKDTLDANVGSMADASVSFDNMRQEFEVLKGSIDEEKHAKNTTTNEYKNLKSYLDERFAKIDKRLGTLEKKAGIATTDTVGEPLPDNLGAVPVARKSEEESYQDAFAEYKKQHYDNARKLFGSFQKQFPQSPKAADAQYFIAESLFLQKNYTDAILAYDELTSKYPKSSHISQAILNQAIAFEQMGQKFDAKLFYEKVISQYPNSEEAKIAKKKLSLMKK